MWYAVRIVVFNKPRLWGHGNLKVFKVSEHLTLSGAKEKAEELERKLKSIDWYRGENLTLPILGFRKEDNYSYEDLLDIIDQGIYSYKTNISLTDADDYLRAWDILCIDRGSFHHVTVYLGKGYICHFTGDKMESSNSSGMKAIKDALRNFFNGSSSHYVSVIRPVVEFKDDLQKRKDVAKAISNNYGLGEYRTVANNCEHFANLIVLGIRYAWQTDNLNSFSGFPNLKEEIRRGKRWFDSRNSGSNYDQIIEEIRDAVLETEGGASAYGNWEERIEVSKCNLSPYCKIQ